MIPEASRISVIALCVAVVLSGICGFMNSMQIKEADKRIQSLEKQVKELQK